MHNVFRVDRNLRVRTNVDYNQFFHPNICHICKSTDQTNLISCTSCQMISYCSEEHRMVHLEEHAEICQLISHLSAEDPNWNKHCFSDEWIQFQHAYMLKIEMSLTRKLKPYETQMFTFAKSCFFCHTRYNVSTCGVCISFCYCVRHAKEIYWHHGVNCFKTAISVNLDIKFLEQTAWKSLYIKFYAFPDSNSLIDTNSFCDRYYRRKRYRSYGVDLWGLNNYAFSDYISDPLTLRNGLLSAKLFRSIELMNTFTIHIIAANYVDRRNFPAWELFLHLLRKKAKLVIVMIGPELNRGTNEYSLCSRCKAVKKRLILESFPLLYHNYMFNSDYRKPNVIIGFQPELYHEVTWSESIRAMQMQNCPLVLTASSTYKLRLDITAIQDILGTSVKPALQLINNFASHRPYRDMHGSLKFRNTRLMIYKNLNA